MVEVLKKLARGALSSGPVLWWRKQRYERKFKHNRDLNLFKGVYPSFQAAQAACDLAIAGSYDNQNSAALYKSFCSKLFPGDYPNLFWLSRILPGQSSLFDLGGHIGVKYYSYSRYLDLPQDFIWSVHDMPAVMDEGETFAREHDPEKKLVFKRSLAEVDGHDILCAFGSLQYIDIDLAQVVATLEKKPRYIIATIPATQKKTYYTLNSIGTAQCPYIIRAESEFLASFEEAGYECQERWIVPDKKCEIPFHPGFSLDYYSGYLFKLKA